MTHPRTFLTYLPNYVATFNVSIGLEVLSIAQRVLIFLAILTDLSGYYRPLSQIRGNSIKSRERHTFRDQKFANNKLGTNKRDGIFETDLIYEDLWNLENSRDNIAKIENQTSRKMHL